MFDPIFLMQKNANGLWISHLFNLDPPFKIPGTAPGLAINSNYLCLIEENRVQIIVVITEQKM